MEEDRGLDTLSMTLLHTHPELAGHETPIHVMEEQADRSRFVEGGQDQLVLLSDDAGHPESYGELRRDASMGLEDEDVVCNAVWPVRVEPIHGDTDSVTEEDLDRHLPEEDVGV